MRSKILKEINTLVTLNEEQQKAVNLVEGNLLIIASAGTGKTTTIVERYVNLVHNHGYLPSQIMMTTFTNKAARDMIRKIYNRTGREPPYVGTMHSLFLRILRRHADRIGLDPRFTLIHDDSDKRKIIKRILTKLELPDKNDEIRYFESWIGKLKNRGILAEKLSENYSLDDNINEGIIEQALDDEVIKVSPQLRRYVNKVYKLYQKQLETENVADLDDILLLTYKLLNENEDLRHQYQVKFKAIMVDEAQDLNLVQMNILNLLKNNNLCLIGDDCQNIYEWRGSSNDLIFDFSENENTVFLKDNYRSEKEIIDSVNKIIGSMRFKIDKNLNCTKPENEDGTGNGKVSIKSFTYPDEEIEFLTYEIKDLIKNGVPKDEIAVLFRTNRIGKDIEKEFNRNRIPCHISKSKDFFEREEIRDILSYLRLRANPNSRVDFHRLLSMVPGIGNSTIRKFEIMAEDNSISLTESLKFADKLLSSTVPEKIAKLKQLKETLENENQNPDDDKDPLELFLKHFNYEAYLTRKYLNEESKLSDKFENISILSELFNDFFEDFSSQQYKTEADYDTDSDLDYDPDDETQEDEDNENNTNSTPELGEAVGSSDGLGSNVEDSGLHYHDNTNSTEGFNSVARGSDSSELNAPASPDDDSSINLEPISADLIEEADSLKNTKEGINAFLDSLIELDKKDKTNRNKVTLSTIHSAKGLEWSHVFVVSCNEKTLPFYRGNIELTSTKRDSELRLFYVALSRAKTNLTITHSDFNQWGSELAPSQFLDILDNIEEDTSFRDRGWDQVSVIEI